MKTIVFALQVFCLMAILPVCLTLDMNHGTKSSYEKKTKENVPEKAATASSASGSPVSMYPIATMAIQMDTLQPKKEKQDFMNQVRL